MVVTKSELNSNRGDAQEVCATHGCISWNDWSILQEGNQICGRPWILEMPLESIHDNVISTKNLGAMVNWLVVVPLCPVVSNFLIKEAYQFPNVLVPFGMLWDYRFVTISLVDCLRYL
ncbi:hypothetical protein CK203_054024 [Vitis vinifera]|uniref:Uncharacterized protein n=1 Tax=Vitis vinifera TaxID=29760 RepID=A0A438GUJ0_VITVI|nr:hypothetical protein CK203_054024 [Vitis vinifera]